MKEIAFIRNILRKSDLSPEEIDSLTSNIRKVMEREGTQLKYRVFERESPENKAAMFAAARGEESVVPCESTVGTS